jgi:hypothetical protein
MKAEGKADSRQHLLHPSAFQREASHAHQRNMNEPGKCPMGKYPWLATFLVVAFFLVFAAHKLGLL